MVAMHLAPVSSYTPLLTTTYCVKLVALIHAIQQQVDIFHASSQRAGGECVFALLRSLVAIRGNVG
jgi:hypothetical protein